MRPPRPMHRRPSQGPTLHHELEAWLARILGTQRADPEPWVRDVDG